MVDTFDTFQQFRDIHLAEEIANKLKEFGIESVLENKTSLVDPIIIGYPSESPLALKIRARDFEKANRFLEEYYQPELNDIDPDYYLFSFTSQELAEVLSHPNKWGHFDRALAKKLLIES